MLREDELPRVALAISNLSSCNPRVGSQLKFVSCSLDSFVYAETRSNMMKGPKQTVGPIIPTDWPLLGDRARLEAYVPGLWQRRGGLTWGRPCLYRRADSARWLCPRSLTES
jgi:hypothetical protein